MDARHSWLDALSSAGALAGLIAVALGQSWGDPVAALAVTVFICHVGYEVTARCHAPPCGRCGPGGHYQGGSGGRIGTRFDVVTCGFAFHFLNHPRQAIAEAYRVLRSGRLLAFSGPPTGPPADQPPDRVGEPGRQRDDWWDFYAELMDDMARRTDEARSPDPFTPPPRPLPEFCAEVGFTGVEQSFVRESFAIRDPQHYWDWSKSYGFRGYVDSLGPRLAGEFRARLLAGLERMHASGGVTVDSTICFTRARKPGGL